MSDTAEDAADDLFREVVETLTAQLRYAAAERETRDVCAAARELARLHGWDARSVNVKGGALPVQGFAFRDEDEVLAFEIMPPPSGDEDEGKA